ncbi:hypothetical protein [Streptomyces sp. NPDC059575]
MSAGCAARPTSSAYPEVRRANATQAIRVTATPPAPTVGDGLCGPGRPN